MQWAKLCKLHARNDTPGRPHIISYGLHARVATYWQHASTALVVVRSSVHHRRCLSARLSDAPTSQKASEELNQGYGTF